MLTRPYGGTLPHSPLWLLVSCITSEVCCQVTLDWRGVCPYTIQIENASAGRIPPFDYCDGQRWLVIASYPVLVILLLEITLQFHVTGLAAKSLRERNQTTCSFWGRSLPILWRRKRQKEGRTGNQRFFETRTPKQFKTLRNQFSVSRNCKGKAWCHTACGVFFLQ